jgi:hypothetical protein
MEDLPMKTLVHRNTTLLVSLLGALFVLSTVLLNPHGAAAAAAPTGVRLLRNPLALSPANQTVTVVPGESYIYYYIVSNDSAQPLKVQFTAKNWAGWGIVGANQGITVPPLSKVRVKIQVKVPSNLTAAQGSNLATITAASPGGSATSYLTFQWGAVDISKP